MEAKLVIDYSDVLAANAAIENMNQSMRHASGGSGGGGSGGNSIQQASSLVAAETRRQRTEAMAQERAHADGIRRIRSEAIAYERAHNEIAANLIKKGSIEEGAKGFRDWDTQLRNVEHSGRGVLNLLGVGGGILGVATLVKSQIHEWYLEMEKMNKASVTLGESLAAVPGGRQMRKQYAAQFEAAGMNEAEIEKAITEGNIGGAIAQGQMKMQRLRAGGTPERAALEKRTAEAHAARMGFEPTAMGEAGDVTAAKIAEMEAMRGAAWQVAGVGKGEPQGAWGSYWRKWRVTHEQHMVYERELYRREDPEGFEKEFGRLNMYPRDVRVVSDDRGGDGTINP